MGKMNLEGWLDQRAATFAYSPAAERQYVTKINPDRSNLIKFSYSSDIYFPYVAIRTLASFESEKHLLIWYFSGIGIISGIGKKCAEIVVPLAQYLPFPHTLYRQV